MTRPLIAAAGLAGLLSACAATPAPTEDAGPDALSSLAGLAGTFSNAAQFAAAPDALKQPPAAGHPYDWLDAQHARFARVDAPGLGDGVFYLEWRAGGPDGPVSRQRLWSFRTDAGGALVMDFFTFNDADPFAGRADEPGAFAALSLEDVRGYGEACALPVTLTPGGGFTAAIPETCAITARSGRTMTLSAEITLDGDRLTYREAGVLSDGTIAFKVPGGPAYAFDRVRAK